jgi:hypothetical protein
MNRPFPNYKSGNSTQGLRVQIAELEAKVKALEAELIRVKEASPDGQLLKENSRLRRIVERDTALWEELRAKVEAINAGTSS